MNVRRTRVVSGATVALAAAVTVGACGDSTSVGDAETVALQFRVPDAAGLAAGVGGRSAGGAAGGPVLVTGAPMVLEGTNGTLTIDEILIIINEVELELSDGSCDDVDNSENGEDDCPEFEAPPRFLDLPLDGSAVDVMTELIPPGTYDELEFEVEDLEDDEDDPHEAAAIAAVRAAILDLVPDWPPAASALVTGRFESAAGGGAADFRVFLEAEIEVEMELLPNLVIGEGGDASRSLTVDIRPDIWFANSDGTVMDLSEWDFDATQQLLEFELEMEDGFTEIEIDG